MKEIKLQAVASQKLSITLGGQNCVIDIFQKPQGMFLSLQKDGVSVVDSVLCVDSTKLINGRGGFAGDLFFNDIDGKSEPVWNLLGSQFFLIYLEESESALI